MNDIDIIAFAPAPRGRWSQHAVFTPPRDQQERGFELLIEGYLTIERGDGTRDVVAAAVSPSNGRVRPIELACPDGWTLDVVDRPASVVCCGDRP